MLAACQMVSCVHGDVCAQCEMSSVWRGQRRVTWMFPPHTKGSSSRINQREVDDDADGDVDPVDFSAVDVDDVGMLA